MPAYEPENVRFWRKVTMTETCWLWTASMRTGYGVFSFTGRKTGMAHRWAYEYFFGPIPADLEIDHICNVRACVRPDHLEAVTPKENCRRREERMGKRHWNRNGRIVA